MFSGAQDLCLLVRCSVLHCLISSCAEDTHVAFSSAQDLYLVVQQNYV